MGEMKVNDIRTQQTVYIFSYYFHVTNSDYYYFKHEIFHVEWNFYTSFVN
jgi:hypothetical protein